MDDIKLVLIGTVGLPRSGKSTFAQAHGGPIVCPDAIRLALHGQRFAPEAEPHVWAIAKTMVRALFHAGHKVVILDATNNTRKRRDAWIDGQWTTIWKVIEADVDTCVIRAYRSDRQDIIPIIEKMAAEHEPLQDDEVAWGSIDKMASE
ncbi:MAG TPA: hypothetical protein ENH62_00895 [Marinobacter sp.]|uniref:Zeta toxin domain-containing protein n=1 Tax=marine sediment metagenome TaxID=412755 RepID=A0A0F9TQI6_9ZZZZ|nr:hypothetical protein [Marinobacter sp.]